MIKKPTIRETAWYGCLPDIPDSKDLCLTTAPTKPDKFSDLDNLFHVPMYNQKALGSCGGHGAERIHRFARNRRGLKDWAGSRLFAYYNARRLFGMQSVDSGASIRDCIKSIAKWGAPHENLWPYQIADFAKTPSSQAYQDGLLNQAILYRRVPQTPDALRGVLTAGWPVVFGATLRESFESEQVEKDGIVPMPADSERIVGQHCLVLWGHVDDTEVYKVANSWWDEDDPQDPMWGDHGFAWMPYDMIHDPNICCNFWVVTGVEDSLEPPKTWWTWLTGLFH